MEWYPPMGTIGQELRTFLFLFFFFSFSLSSAPGKSHRHVRADCRGQSWLVPRMRLNNSFRCAGELI